MTATEELRRLLDERGMEWDADDEAMDDGSLSQVTYWYCNGIEWSADGRDEYLAFDAAQLITPEQAIAATLGQAVPGETSDGYHTFNELYHHRAVLFSVIVRDHRELAWKSKAHHDGTMYEGMFIVGIETPEGQATYHYDIDPYWDMFDCKELDRAPEWDGHTPDDAIGRIAKLGRWTCHDKGNIERFICSECGCRLDLQNDDWEATMWLADGAAMVPRYCPNCGRRVEVNDG